MALVCQCKGRDCWQWHMLLAQDVLVNLDLVAQFLLTRHACYAHEGMLDPAARQACGLHWPVHAVGRLSEQQPWAEAWRRHGSGYMWICLCLAPPVTGWCCFWRCPCWSPHSRLCPWALLGLQLAAPVIISMTFIAIMIIIVMSSNNSADYNTYQLFGNTHTHIYTYVA